MPIVDRRMASFIFTCSRKAGKIFGHIKICNKKRYSIQVFDKLPSLKEIFSIDKYWNVRDDDENMIWTQNAFISRISKYLHKWKNGNSNGKYKINSILCDFFL